MHTPRSLVSVATCVAIASLAGCTGSGGSSGGPPAELTDVAFGHDRFVAVGARTVETATDGDIASSGMIFTSTDGASWSAVDVDVDAALWSVVYSGDRFVAVGGDFVINAGRTRGVLLTSTDGVSWQSTPSPDVAVSGVAYGAGTFVATTFDTRVLRSTDGVHWDVLDANLGSGIHHVTFGNGVFVAATDTSEIAVSSDGAAWQTITVDPLLGVRSVSFINGAFLAGLDSACADGGCVGQPNPASRSTDGVHWTQASSNVGDVLYDVTDQAGVLVGATPSALVRSTDGAAWSPASGSGNRGWTAVAAGNSGFVAVGLGFAASSADGATWAEIAVDAP